MAPADFALILILLIGLMPTSYGHFDLNELPDIDSDVTQDVPAIDKSSFVRRQATDRRLTKDRIAKLNELQGKVEELFARVAICDVENFNIAKIRLPDSWSKESGAMMALKRVAGKKLIRKKDIDRYRRIMTNCNQISRIFEERAARDTNSMIREISGGKNYDAAKIQELMDLSPLDALKNRFNNWSAKSHEAPEPGKEGETPMFPRSPPRSISYGARHNRSLMRLMPLEIVPIKEKKRVSFFKFL